jgi:hypothetical protein
MNNLSKPHFLKRGGHYAAAKEDDEYEDVVIMLVYMRVFTLHNSACGTLSILCVKYIDPKNILTFCGEQSLFRFSGDAQK